MAWQDYLDLEFIKLNGKHVSGALAAILGFSLVTWVSGKLVDPGYLLTVIQIADEIVVTGCIIYLAVAILWELVGKLIKLARGNGSTPSILAA